MDMNVSPDLEAFCCYGLVLLLGLAVAWSQVSGRLGKLPGQWIMVNTWLLFFAYTFVPVLLFWFLDRTNAVHDTSLFAAVLVGFGYQQILTGSLGSIRAPGDVSKFWQPFGIWADSISDRIRERIIVNSSQFDERLLSTIRTDDAKFAALKAVALVHVPDANLLDQSLGTIAANQNVLGDTGVRAKQASLLYETLQQSSPQQFEYLLYKNDVIPKRWYFWYALEWRSKTTAILVAAVLLASAVGGVADSILGLLVETRQSATKNGVDLQALLVDALRTENSDIRTRIHKVLVYLAKDRGAAVPPDLENWQSDPKYSATDVDKTAAQWSRVK